MDHLPTNDWDVYQNADDRPRMVRSKIACIGPLTSLPVGSNGLRAVSEVRASAPAGGSLDSGAFFGETGYSG
jgi:hypothetical protein